jgi:hypothetical protein
VHFKELVEESENIVISHELLKYISKKQIKKLKDYNLILDEVMDIVEVYKNITKKDITKLLKERYLHVDDSGKVIALDKDFFDYDHWKELRTLIEDEKLYMYGDKVIMVDLSTEILKSFKSVTVMSYLVEGSYLYQILKEDFVIEKKQIDDYYNVTDWDRELASKRAKAYYNLINLYNQPSLKKNIIAKINDTTKLTFSATNRLSIEKKTALGQLVRSYFRNENKEAGKCLYSNFGNQFEVKDYKTSFLAYNHRATNEYRDRDTLAYLVEKHNNPIIKNYVQNKYNAEVNEDYLSLDALLQWVFRSAIRERKPINLLLPSLKMRELLHKWGTGELK